MKNRLVTRVLMAAATGMVIAAAPATAQTPAPSTVKLTASVDPNPPRAGDNTIDLLAVDGAGQPAKGLKLAARVAMTSMDMGTSRPAVKEVDPGHYRLRVTFSMAGPWRVTFSSGAARAALDFDAGGKSAWKSRPLTLAQSPSPAMPGMAMGAPAQAQTSSGRPMPFPGYGPYGPPSADDAGGMAMPGMAMSTGSKGGPAPMEDMKPLKMSQLPEQGTETATGRENWKIRAGFGKNGGMVGMMGQMMIGGSGMEGMKMPAMKMDFGEQNFTEDPDDDTGGSASGSAMPGMPMDQGTPGKDQGMSGKTPSAAPSMPGMTMDQGKPDKIPPSAPKTAGPMKITGAISSPKSGGNRFTITVTDSGGSPVTGARVTTTVAMTSMDMGTAHPRLKEIGAGRYQGTVNFGMAGPWRVTVKVSPPQGGPAQTQAFDFDAK